MKSESHSTLHRYSHLLNRYWIDTDIYVLSFTFVEAQIRSNLCKHKRRANHLLNMYWVKTGHNFLISKHILRPPLFKSYGIHLISNILGPHTFATIFETIQDMLLSTYLKQSKICFIKSKTLCVTIWNNIWKQRKGTYYFFGLFFDIYKSLLYLIK